MPLPSLPELAHGSGHPLLAIRASFKQDRAAARAGMIFAGAAQLAQGGPYETVGACITKEMLIQS